MLRQLMSSVDPAMLQASGTLPAAMAQARDAVWAEANVTIDGLKAQLAATQSAERQQAEAHERAEEDMRRSFMRSICTLNIEVRPADATLMSVAAETLLTSRSTPLTGLHAVPSPFEFNTCWWPCRQWASCSMEVTGAMASRQMIVDKGRRRRHTLRVPSSRRTTNARHRLSARSDQHGR